ncbi:hypothetical protein [Enterococcus sp. BWR-S5]|uniref:hypothetical protein n=1 Tax=Enterococcus sp. BWR-S5 TaxID=2787714 RepID=UPI0019218EFA|nr:hypothetical protein [Enterococcus sp. BWR-S5]MBL1223936.1 hypothetical protein [Enterococcus sp. BWR-S5]
MAVTTFITGQESKRLNESKSTQLISAPAMADSRRWNVGNQQPSPFLQLSIINNDEWGKAEGAVSV